MAAITAAVVAAGATAYAANKQSKAAKDAANQSSQAAQDSNQLQWDMYQQNRQDLEPWRQSGMGALGEINALLGLQSPGTGFSSSDAQAYLSKYRDVAKDPFFGKNPYEHFLQHGKKEGRTWGGANPQQSQQAAFDRFRATPGYQFQLDEGRNQVEASAAARGGLNSGATLKALTRFGQGVADQTYGNHYNRLASLAGIGQTATTQTGQWGQNYAQNAGNNLINAGNQRAQSTYARGQAQADMAGNFAGIAGMLGNYYSNRPAQTGMASGYTAPSASWASGFGNNTGWLGGGW